MAPFFCYIYFYLYIVHYCTGRTNLNRLQFQIIY